MHTESETLKTLFASVSGIRPKAEDSPQRLMSLSRAYLAVHELLMTGYPAWEGVSTRVCTELGDRLFKAMLQKTAQDCPTAEKLRLISEMYGLLNGTSLYMDGSKSELWNETAAKAIEDYLDSRAGNAGATAGTAACLCLLDWFYLMEDVDDDPWMEYLKTTIGTWSASYTPEGWTGTGFETALERLEAMSRNSYMLLDPSHDGTVREAFLYYSHKAAASPTLPHTALGRLYDIATGGDSLPGELETGHFAATGLRRIESASAPGSDTRLYCTSYRIADLCRDITKRLQAQVITTTTYKLDINHLPKRN